MLSKALAIIVALAIPGCALAYPPADSKFKPEAVHPSPERLAELVALPIKGKKRRPVEAKFEIRAPQFVYEGAELTVECRVPLAISAGRVFFGLGDEISAIAGGERAREGISHRLKLMNLPCGSYVLVCALATGERLTQPLLVKGQCNADSTGEW